MEGMTMEVVAMVVMAMEGMVMKNMAMIIEGMEMACPDLEISVIGAKEVT